MLFQTHFIYFNSSIYKLNNLKMYKFLINFNYILFSLVSFIGQTNIRKSFFQTFFFLSLYFLGTKHNPNDMQENKYEKEKKRHLCHHDTL